MCRKSIKDLTSEVNKSIDVENSKYSIVRRMNFRKKDTILNFKNVKMDSLLDKSSHMINLYNLGMICRKIVEDEVMKEIKTHTNFWKNICDGFNYPWELCCLCHDLLSKQEHHNQEFKNLDEFCEEEIDHTIYNFNISDNICVSEFKPIYDENLVKTYFLYRTKSEALDHGIAGGYYIFDRLVKKYLQERNRAGENEFRENTEYGDVFWHQDQIWMFAYIADAIIVHNMWHLPESKFLEKGIKDIQVLEPLILDSPNEKKLKLDETPLAYFFSLMDTIEPIKYFTQLDEQFVLENIYLEVGIREIIISQSELKAINLEKWFNDKMKSMSDWLEGIEARYNPNKNQIEILIPFAPDLDKFDRILFDGIEK